MVRHTYIANTWTDLIMNHFSIAVDDEIPSNK